ncbi:unnamed protein product [Arabidopsis thaliana]|uniref:DUF577 domain-containing protein n=2 Tax=Arabidopsis TaxID=3701 RepID=A0A178WBB6_ARATH|nr:hypothetical protein ISN45_At01g056570 [Arabidopsis thaliana x Arabidopsis arenosa]OAP15091.1 hypothetical protein AXX17_AT1G59780 [Arabidopsis thaliana]VYS50147.1 unnamed protein product [Arabidopsis thaliana]
MTSHHYDVASSSNPPPPLTASRIYIGNKAKEILATRDITEITKLVTTLCYGKETEQSSSSSKLLYEVFTKHFPNILVSKLLQIYSSGTDITPKIRSFSLYLLDSLLTDIDDFRGGLKTESLDVIKNRVSTCLLSQETSYEDFKLLSRIVSRVCVDVFIGDKPWDELCSYILSLDGNKKALLMFSELPTVLDEEFLMPLLDNGLGLKIVSVLLMNQDYDEEEWCLALEAGFSLILQLVNLDKKSLVWDLVYVIVKSVWEMVNVKRREIVVRKGFVRVAKKVRREALRFREAEYEVVSRLGLMMLRINGLGEVTMMMVTLIHEILERYYMGGHELNQALLNQFFY